MAVNTIERYRMARYAAWQWRSELSLVQKLILAFGMAALVGLAAQVRIPLPWTPVPITGQTTAALLAGVLLGRTWGGVSLGMYIGLGAAGLPWFAGWTAGAAVLAGATGGYLVGFILAAMFVGFVIDKYPQMRTFNRMAGVMFLANFVLIFGPGLLQLNLWLSLVNGQSVGLYRLLVMGLFPFVAGEVIKTLAAAGAGWALTPKQDR
ncbi:MAG: biotin transporter BioY [Chloroflexi bacterium]|nr:biotin transporter BioY [Chloroflexota bacterium]